MTPALDELMWRRANAKTLGLIARDDVATRVGALAALGLALGSLAPLAALLGGLS